jgi:5'-nucleotidase
MRHALGRTSVALAGLAGLLAGPLAAPAAAAPVSIQILSINDFHGRLAPDATAGVPGAAMLAGAVNAFRAQNPNTVLVSAGDNIGASPFASAVQQDAPTIDVLNRIGVDVTAVGNHEFDRGWADLAGRVSDLADYAHLGANVQGEVPDLPAHEVVNVGGVAVGFVGVVTEETGSLVSPAGIPGITFTDPVAAANAAADRLSDGDAANGEADVVVLLAHEGSATVATTPEACATMVARDDAFGRIVRNSNANIDAIIGGHTHLRVDCDTPHPRGGGLIRPVTEAAQYGQALGRLQLTVDPDTDTISSVSADVVEITGFTPDATIAAVVQTAVDQAAVIGRVPVGRITADITRAVTSTGAEDRGAESTLSNFIADVQLAATAAPNLGGAQIAFMNPGGLRADLRYASSADGEGDGVVTYAEAAAVQPFANGVVTMSLTGAQIKQALEQQWQPAGASRPFLHLGVSEGFRYVYDPAMPTGSRILAMTLNGTPIDPVATYRVTVNSFLASGGDNFTVLAQGTQRQDNGFNDLNVLVDYFEQNSPVSPDAVERAVLAGPLVDDVVTGFTVSAPTVAAGGTADYTVTVTSTRAVDAPFTLRVTLPAGVDLVSAPAGCSASGATVTCALASLASGTTTLTMRVSVPTDRAPGSVAGTATLTLDPTSLEVARQDAPEQASFTTTVLGAGAPMTAVAADVTAFRAQGRISATTHAQLIDRLVRAQALAEIGSETRTIGYLQQFIAKANNQVRDAAARAALVTAVQRIIADLELAEDLENAS